MLIGSARVSTQSQSLDLQINALKKAGCEKIFTDIASGAKTARPGLKDAEMVLREGDASSSGLTGVFMLSLMEIVDIKYLNNIVEQSHRWVKQKTRQALGWKSIDGAHASLHGREI